MKCYSKILRPQDSLKFSEEYTQKIKLLTQKQRYIMARNMQANQVLSNSIVKHLVKSVDETKLADLMTFLPQQVILFLLGEYTPLQVGDAYPDQDRFRDGKITYVNYLTGTYGIEYTYVEHRYFKTEEEAKKFAESRDYSYSTSSGSKKEEYPFKGEYTSKSNTETEWVF